MSIIGSAIGLVSVHPNDPELPVQDSSDSLITEVAGWVQMPFGNYTPDGAMYSYDSVLTLTRIDSGNISAGGTTHSSLTFHIVADFATSHFTRWECDQDPNIYMTLPTTNYEYALVIPGNTPSSETVTAQQNLVPFGRAWYKGTGSTYQYSIRGNRAIPPPPTRPSSMMLLSEEDTSLIAPYESPYNYYFGLGYTSGCDHFHLSAGTFYNGEYFRWATQNANPSFNYSSFDITIETSPDGVSWTTESTNVYIAGAVGQGIFPCCWVYSIARIGTENLQINPTRERWPTHFPDGSYVY